MASKELSNVIINNLEQEVSKYKTKLQYTTFERNNLLGKVADVEREIEVIKGTIAAFEATIKRYSADKDR